MNNRQQHQSSLCNPESVRERVLAMVNGVRMNKTRIIEWINAIKVLLK